MLTTAIKGLSTKWESESESNIWVCWACSLCPGHFPSNYVRKQWNVNKLFQSLWPVSCIQQQQQRVKNHHAWNNKKERTSEEGIIPSFFVLQCLTQQTETWFDLIWFDLSTAWYMIHVFLDHRLSTQSIDWVDIWMTDPSGWWKFWHWVPPHRNCLMASTIDAKLGLFVQKV